MCGGCCVEELLFVGVKVYMVVAAWENCGVRKLHCGGVSVCGGHGGCQSLIHCVFGVFIFSSSFWFCANKKKIF